MYFTVRALVYIYIDIYISQVYIYIDSPAQVVEACREEKKELQLSSRTIVKEWEAH